MSRHAFQALIKSMTNDLPQNILPTKKLYYVSFPGQQTVIAINKVNNPNL